MSNITSQKWYAIPADNAISGKPSSVNWQIATEDGALIVHEGDREAVEHIVDIHNAVISGEAKALTWATRIREVV